MYLVKHKSIGVFIDGNGVYKVWDQCKSPRLFSTPEEVEAFCLGAKINDATPFLICKANSQQAIEDDIYFPQLNGAYGLINAQPHNLVPINHIDTVGEQFCDFVLVEYKDLIFNW
jgi:hypothetical protein